MFPISHVNGMQMIDSQHLKRDVEGDDGMVFSHFTRNTNIVQDLEQSPNKRMRIEDPLIYATLQGKQPSSNNIHITYCNNLILALAEKHFKEMAELTARHSANSRKLISHNSAIRVTTDLRHAKEKGL